MKGPAAEYLEKEDVLPALELGLEKMLRECSAADSKTDPINYLATWLFRNNPKHNKAVAASIAEKRAAESEEAAAASKSGDTLALDVNVSNEGKVSLAVDVAE